MKSSRTRPADGGSDGKGLTPTERVVRKLLLELAPLCSQLPGKPSLQDWVEERMPGEIVLGVDAAGSVILESVVAREKSGKYFAPDDPFYDSLLPDFTKAELVLRGCLLDMLAMGPLPISDILADVQMSGYRSAALPKHIPLEGWIERRIGAEVVVKMEGNQLLCELVGDQESTNQSHGRDPDLDLDESKAAFFEGLPEDELTPEELALRQALIDFLENRKKTGPPNLSEAGMNEAVRKCRIALLPQKVSMKEWIVHRVGQEFFTQRLHDGQISFGLSGNRNGAHGEARIPCRFWLRGSCSKGVECRFFHDPALEGQGSSKYGKKGDKGKGDKSKGSDAASSGKGKDSGRRGSEPERRPRDQEDGTVDTQRKTFFSSLPAGSLTGPELDLRQALIDALNDWKGPGSPCLAHVGSWGKIQSAKWALLPKGVSMKQWIDNRIGGEIKTWELEAANGIGIGAAKVFFGFPGDEPAPGALVQGDAADRDSVCPFWQKGFCKKGASCRYLHHEQDSQQENSQQETEVCSYWRQGRCARGDGCRYRHPPEEEGADGKEKEARVRPDDFFSSLPEDRLTHEEQRLRSGLLAFLENWSGPGRPCLADVGKDETVRSAKHNLLPKGVSIAKWISSRIGGEIKTWDVQGHVQGAQKVFFSLVGDELMEEDMSAMEPKSKPCKYWADGFCKLGSECRFSHDEADRGRKRDAGNSYHEQPAKRRR
eukprot:TRINITY_DN4049_c0_g2_i2.p1 TRINITY_DN4049_c0_g2~~TRINITY_DN4049_c0_g2_i2.p1  ORF type:complete len:754 (+),score=115.45 TRINITY_DN4049_c0_g2_i2:124-2262(+)